MTKIHFTAFVIAFASLIGILSGCQSKTSKSNSTNAFSDEMKIPYGDRLELDGAAAVEREADIKNSPYYIALDFYNMRSTDTLAMLTNYKTIQQATEWTCGPTTALTVLEWFGRRGDLNEIDLVALRKKDEPGATNLRQMINIFEGLGGWDIYSTYDLEDPDEVAEDMLLDFLLQGKPIMIGWDEWGGHWQVVIGYDTMGTEYTADDVLILMDPYDTTDHCQDGYVIHSFERLYYNWINTFDPDFERNVFLVVSPK